MKIRDLSVLTCFLMTCAGAAPALAGLAPYVRLDYGQNELRMSGANRDIQESEALFRADGYPAAFQTVGFGYGPGVSAGLWLRPGLRFGVTYSYLRAVLKNGLNVPGEVFFADALDLRMNEIGVEAAVRCTRLAGLTLGANVAGGRGEMIEKSLSRVPGFEFEMDQGAHRTRMTCGAFVGIDQTNRAGVAGFIRAGYQYRDLGHMRGHWRGQLTSVEGVETDSGAGLTPEMDYSGYYVKVGVGYDLVR